MSWRSEQRHLVADNRACVMTMLAVASGALDETRFATWLREYSAHRG